MNVSFLIALKIDSQDRVSNLDISVKNLSHHFPNSEIIISEMDDSSKIENRYTDIKNCKHVFTKTSDFCNKQKAYNISAGQFFKTDLDFSLYGTTYGPGNSPYGTIDLFYSDIA